MNKTSSTVKDATAVQLRNMLRARQISCVELLSHTRLRFEDINPKINAIPTQCFDIAMEQARRIDDQRQSSRSAESVLGGIPICIKDLTAVSGVRSTWGTRALAEFVPANNDPIVDRLIQSGALIIGKSNTPEMGAGNVTFNDVFGATRNPWNLDRNPGGSSGGSCAAVASRILAIGHGTDLAGSLRNPAAYCGVVALRPSPGRAGGPPQSVAFNTETVHGPIARTVADVALLLDAMVGYDLRVPISLEAPSTSFLDQVDAGPVRPYRLAFSMTLGGFANVESAVGDAIEAAIASISRRGISIREATPELPQLYETYSVLRSMLWATAPGSQPSSVQQYFKRTLAQNIRKAYELSVSDIYRALSNRTKLYNSMLAFFREYDCLVCPVIGKQPGPIDEEYPREVAGEQIDDYVEWLRFSFLAPAASLPAIAIPVGLDSEGLPVGLQLIGRPRGEAELLVIASVLERELGFSAVPALAA